MHALVSLLRVLAVQGLLVEGSGDVAEEGVTDLVAAQVLDEFVEDGRVIWGIAHCNNYYFRGLYKL
jgi:hypothetical protein